MKNKIFQDWFNDKKNKIVLNTWDYEVDTCCEDVPLSIFENEIKEAFLAGFSKAVENISSSKIYASVEWHKCLGHKTPSEAIMCKKCSGEE